MHRPWVTPCGRAGWRSPPRRRPDEPGIGANVDRVTAGLEGNPTASSHEAARPRRGARRPKTVKSPQSERAIYKSGRLDLNQRPFGPQPNALPDCATPRGRCEFTSSSVPSGYEHVFVSQPRQELKKCCRCGEFKPLSDYAWRRRKKGQRDTHCRPCRSAYGKEHYEANRARYIAQAAKVKRRMVRERTLFLLRYFKSHPCVDCGETDPVVLEFDHLRDKSFAVSQGLSRASWERVLQEIEKCEVVCANCHRRRTARRRGSLRAVLTAGS